MDKYLGTSIDTSPDRREFVKLAAGGVLGSYSAFRPSDVRSLSEATRRTTIEEQDKLGAGALRIES